MDFQQLLEKLHRIEALHAHASTEGEREAAAEAQKRLKERLAGTPDERVQEYKFSLADTWSQRLFMALCRKHGLSPYRYRGQRRTTVMVRSAESFVNEHLWPEYQGMAQLLQEHLDELTTRVISEVLKTEDVDASEQAALN